MAIQVLSSTNYYYAGQADSRPYNSESGTNTMLIVCVSASTGGSGVVPTSRGITYNGVAMTEQTGGEVTSNDISTYSYLYTLVNPATGSNTLAINYSNGTSWGMNIAVYTLGNVSNAPISAVSFNQYPSTNDYFNQTDTRTRTPTSTGELAIDAVGFPATPDAGQTKNGNYSTRKLASGLSAISLVWTSNNYYPTGYSHSIVYIRERKDVSVSDTVASGDSGVAVKGILVLISDTILMSDLYAGLKKIYITVSDTLNIKNRGWFGSVQLFTNISKVITSWSNKNKD